MRITPAPSSQQPRTHAKIQGMARSDSMPAFGLRLAGREPMFMRPSSEAGVEAWKYWMNLGSLNTTPRYWSHDTLDMRAMTSRHSGRASVGGFSECSSVAAVYRSSVRKHISSVPNSASIISPWMVTRSRPLMVPGGCDRMARCDGPPPRPTVPPRPWNSVMATPNSAPTLHTSSCPWYSAQAADMRPASLPESE